jgi:MFS family permease
MLRSIWSISSLLVGMGILLSGSGLLGIQLGLRGAQEAFDNLTLGIVMSAFYLGYMGGAWICPPLIMRVGHIRAFASFAAVAAVVSLMYGLVVGPIPWWCLRIANGVALMGIYMVIESWLNERAQTARARIFALYMMVNLIAIAIGQYLVVVEGTEGLGSFAIAAILFCLGLLPIALTPLRQPEPVKTPSLSLGKLFRSAPTGVIGSLASGLILGSFWALSAIYARSLGLDNLGVANFTASAIVGGALLQWPIGWLSDRRDRREVLTVVATGAALVLSALALVDLAGPSPSPKWYMPLAFGIGAFMFSIYGLAVAQTHDRFPPSEALEATKGLLLVHGMGAVTGPLICGGVMQLLDSRGFPITLAVMAVALAAFTAMRIRRDPPVPPESRGSFVAVDQNSPGEMEMPRREPTAAEAAAEAAAVADGPAAADDAPPGPAAPATVRPVDEADVTDAVILEGVDRRRP